MEYLSVIFLHVLFGILWAGGAIAIGFFVIPAVFDAGPAGGAVMGGIVKRKFPIVMTISGVIVVLSGLRLYMLRFTADWIWTPEGLVLTLGALLGLGAFGIGLFVQKPTADKLTTLAAKLAVSGAPPSPAEAAELQSLRLRMRKVSALTAAHLLGAATLMALHRFAAAIPIA